jgi:prevent-host-death family protein
MSMSLRVPIRQLKAQLSHFLAEARAGHAIEVTSHQKVIARIIGVPDAEGRLGRLIASGAVTWQGGKPSGARIPLSAQSHSTLANQVIEDRG